MSVKVTRSCCPDCSRVGAFSCRYMRRASNAFWSVEPPRESRTSRKSSGFWNSTVTDEPSAGFVANVAQLDRRPASNRETGRSFFMAGRGPGETTQDDCIRQWDFSEREQPEKARK